MALKTEEVVMINLVTFWGGAMLEQAGSRTKSGQGRRQSHILSKVCINV
jgi:hypothetical protein